jgi:membrane protease YdiL (CAAX protease family)
LALLLAFWLRARARDPHLAATCGWVAIALLGWFAVSAAAGASPASQALVACAGAAALLVLAFVARKRLAVRGALAMDDGPPREALRTVGLGLLYIYGPLVRSACVMAAAVAYWPQGPSSTHPAVSMLAAGGADAAILAATAIVLAPLGEELLCRGVLLPPLCRAYGARTAIALTGVFFGALHLGQGVWWAATTTVIGVVLGWARVRSRGLAAPIALHAAVNALFVGAWLRVIAAP